MGASGAGVEQRSDVAATSIVERKNGFNLIYKLIFVCFDASVGGYLLRRLEIDPNPKFLDRAGHTPPWAPAPLPPPIPPAVFRFLSLSISISSLSLSNNLSLSISCSPPLPPSSHPPQPLSMRLPLPISPPPPAANVIPFAHALVEACFTLTGLAEVASSTRYTRPRKGTSLWLDMPISHVRLVLYPSSRDWWTEVTMSKAAV